MTSVDEILNYERKESEDYYGILGCDENSSVNYNKYCLLNKIVDMFCC